MAGANNFPKLHNAMWPGLVGKGSDSEPPIDLDTMLDLTAKAEVKGVKFDGIDIFHAAPHTNIDFTDDEVKQSGREGTSPWAGNRLHRGPRLAAGGRRLGYGLGFRSEEVRGERAEIMPPRTEIARPGREALRRHPHRLGNKPRRICQGPQGQHQESCPDFPRGVQRCGRL